MVKRTEYLSKVTNDLMDETDKLMKKTMDMMPSSDMIASIDPQSFEMLQSSLKLVESSKAVVKAQLEYYDGIETSLEEILAELKELKQLQLATNKVAKEK